MLHSDDSNDTLYTLVNELNVHVDGSIILEAFPALDILFELDEISDAKFCQILKSGNLSDVVVTRLENKFKTHHHS